MVMLQLSCMITCEVGACVVAKEPVHADSSTTADVTLHAATGCVPGGSSRLHVVQSQSMVWGGTMRVAIE